MNLPISDLPDAALVERFDDLLWKVGNKIGKRPDKVWLGYEPFDPQIWSELGNLKWMMLVNASKGEFLFMGAVVCYDDAGVVYRRAWFNGKSMESAVHSYSMMRRYLPLLEQQIPLECLAEIPGE